MGGAASSRWLKDLDLTKPIDMGFTEKVFAEFDKDHNGVLDREETQRLVRKWCNHHGLDAAQSGVRFQAFWDKFAVGGVITKEVLMGNLDKSSKDRVSTPTLSVSSIVQAPVNSPGYSPNFKPQMSVNSYSDDGTMYQTAPSVPLISLYIKTLATRAEAAAMASVIYTSHSPTSLVKELMQLIVETFKVPLEHQTLVCEDKLLEPENSLSSYELKNDDVIVLADRIPFVKEVTSVGQVKQHLDNGGSLGGDREAGCLVWSDRKRQHYHVFWEGSMWCAKAQPQLTAQESEAARVKSAAMTPTKPLNLGLSTSITDKSKHSRNTSAPPYQALEPNFPEQDAPPRLQEDIHWRRGVEIGSGSFGKVFQAQNVKTGELMAVKQVKIKLDSDEKKAQVQQLEREIAAMATLKHPNIVQMFRTEVKQDKINILMEYVPGASLAAQLKQFGPFEEAHARKYTKQLLEALAYCHAAGIVHRDIKGSNILVSLQGSPKLADFGSAKRFVDVNADDHLSVGYCYTTEWTAPEVFAHGSYNSKVDIWSVGCVVIEMMTGKLPWAEQKFMTRERAMFFIGTTTLIPAIPLKLSPQGQDFLLRCLERDPVKRASAVDLLGHDWIKAA